jgi:hypothetical protein
MRNFDVNLPDANVTTSMKLVLKSTVRQRRGNCIGNCWLQKLFNYIRIKLFLEKSFLRVKNRRRHLVTLVAFIFKRNLCLF